MVLLPQAYLYDACPTVDLIWEASKVSRPDPLDGLRQVNLEYNLTVGPVLGIIAGVLLIPVAIYLGAYFLLVFTLVIPACAWVLKNRDRLRHPSDDFPLSREKQAGL